MSPLLQRLGQFISRTAAAVSQAAPGAASNLGQRASNLGMGFAGYARTVTDDVLLGGKPLFYEKANREFIKWRNAGRAGTLKPRKKFGIFGPTIDRQAEYNTWSQLKPSERYKKSPVPPRIITFNESLRKKLYAGAYLYAGVSAASAAAYHQDPSIPVVDLSDKSMDYGATGEYVLSSYYNNR